MGESGPFDHVATYEDLLRFLQEWINFGGDDPPYDPIGITHLFLACLDNMRQHFSDEDLAELSQLPDREQLVFLERLLVSMRQPRE